MSNKLFVSKITMKAFEKAFENLNAYVILKTSASV